MILSVGLIMFEINKKTVKLNLNIDPRKRMIFMSDIHGRYKLFDTALKDLNFSADDFLFIIGDLIEKNDNNLEMLDYMIEFKKNNSNVYILSGNCDDIFRKFIPPVDEELIYNYATKRGNSIINDIVRRMNIVIDKNIVFGDVLPKFMSENPKYFEFLDSLVDLVVINDKIALVHGGIEDTDDIPENPRSIKKKDAFYYSEGDKKLLTIVGHYPTLNYSKNVASLNPIIDLNKKIISIDGGLGVTIGGQLNALILNDFNEMKFSFKSYDNYETIKLISNNDIYLNLQKINLQYGYYKVRVIEDMKDYVKVVFKDDNKKEMIIPKFYLLSNFEGYFICQGFQAFENFKTGDNLKLIYSGSPFHIIKKDGILSYIDEKAVKL